MSSAYRWRFGPVLVYTALASTSFVSFLATRAPSHAETVFQNPGIGSWFDDSNWSAGEPNSTTNAAVTNGGTAQLATGGTGQALTLTVNAPSQVEVFKNSTLILSSSAGNSVITLEGGTLVSRSGAANPTFATGVAATSSGGTIDSSNDQLRITGVISGGANSFLTLTDTGSNTDFYTITFLSGSNTIAGTLIVDHNAVSAAANDVFGLGTLSITATGYADLGGYDQHIHNLRGSGFFNNLNLAGTPGSTRTNVLTVDTGEFTGVIQDSTLNYGNGVVSSGIISLVKASSGTLTLSGANTFSGGAEVQAGTLLVDGLITSAATVDGGATIGGRGTVGALDLLAGATLSPGFAAPYQTLRVTGDAAFARGTTFQVHIDPAGQNDAVTIGGTATIDGGTVSVLPAGGSYAPARRYTILTAAGGRTGQFAAVQSTMAFLTPALSYDPDDVYLDVTQTAPMTSAAQTQNQRATAAAVESLGPGNPVYDEIGRAHV